MTLASKVGAINKWKKSQDKDKGKTDGKTEDKKKDYLPIEEYRKKQYDEAPKWKKRKPKNLNDTKEVDGKTHHWCVHHKIWQMHKSEKCRINKGGSSKGDPKKDEKNEGKDDEKSNEKDKKQGVRFNVKANIAAADDESDEDF
jgi:hypothetical protein